MDRINYDKLDVLYRTGFTQGEIERLVRFCRRYKKNEQDQACLDFVHLRFIRWLVEHGKLTEQLS